MSLFEKYCWYYNNVNSRAFELMKGSPNFKVFRYEDLFGKSTRDKYFLEMLDYSSGFDDGFTRKYTYQPELFDVKIHAAASKRQLPGWEEWDNRHVEAMENHCGALMREYGYGTEPLWQKKLGKLKRQTGTAVG
jgi:hypothetical protein